MKRLAKRTIVIAAVLLVLAAIVGGTAYGYFFSGRTIENNVASTGSIILSVNDDGEALPIVLPGLLPGDSGTAGNYQIENVGTSPGTLWVGVSGNALPFDEGLARALLTALWLDADASNTWTAGDKYFVPDHSYASWQAGDSVAVPIAAYNSLFDWNDEWSNTLDVAAGSGAGILKMTYVLPSTVDDPALMGKACNFNLMVELHQDHYDVRSVTVGSLSGHTGVTWTAVADGIIVDQGSIVNGATSTVLTLPIDTYSIVFEDDNAWTWTKNDVDITVSNFGPFDLPA